MIEQAVGQLPIDPRVGDILTGCLSGHAPTREDLIHLLGFGEHTLEASVTRATADAAGRERFGNEGMLLGQIGIETFPCPANCRFCVFGEGHTTFPETRLVVEEVVARSRAFAAGGDLFAVFLMTMHEFELDRLLDIVDQVRKAIPPQTKIVVNIGDFDRPQAEMLKATGASGAYHVCRLREGTDTDLDSDDRKRTFEIIREADLDFYYCCEPIGPEHSAEELVDQMLLGVEYGCFQHAAMRRVYVPGGPLAHHGQITELRLAQVVAVVTLATLGCERTENIAIHEPNLIGLTSGANVVYAETGANPRDTAEDTSGHRGLDMAMARRMLYEAGYSKLRRGDDERIPLDLAALAPVEA
jgi:biotin synthase